MVRKKDGTSKALISRRGHACGCRACLQAQQSEEQEYNHRHRRPLTPPLIHEQHETASPSAPRLGMVRAFKRKLFHKRPKTVDQQQSPLFKLHAEIRKALFIEAVGNHTLHLAFDWGRVSPE